MPKLDQQAPKQSPWGTVQDAIKLADGAWSVSTPSHGGIKLSAKLNAGIPDYMRREDGWYEEDCDWCIPVMVYPEFALAMTWTSPAGTHGGWTVEQILNNAKDTLRNWHPESYARFYGVPIESLRGQSYKYDQRCFAEEQANNLVSVVAWGDWHKNVPEGMVGIGATLGGDRAACATVEYFLVPKERYTFPYVVRQDDLPWCGPDGEATALSQSYIPGTKQANDYLRANP